MAFCSALSSEAGSRLRARCEDRDCGRLIREEQKRLINEGTTEGDALAFASGELAGAVANAFLETDTIEEFEGTIFILC